MLGSNNKSDATLIVLKPVSKNSDGESVKPYFEISRRINDDWQVSDDTSVSMVTGTLSKVEVKEEEYKGDKYFRVKVCLKDGKEIYLLSLRLNIATRSLLNSLFSLEDFDNVSISYYRSRAGYDVYHVSQNSERVKWKFEISDIPAPDEVTFKGKTIKDYTKVDNFFAEQATKLGKRVSSVSSSVDKEAVKETVSSENEVEF